MARLLEDDMEGFTVGSFGFSGIRAEKLTASEYTVVTVARDVSGSTWGHEQQILECMLQAIAACKQSPRASYLLLRSLEFNDKVLPENHGFIHLADVDPAKYVARTANGGTALYDALYSSVAAANLYGKQQLIDKDFTANAISFIITDGWDESSSMGPKDILAELVRVTQAEEIESHMVVLIGVNAAQCSAKLQALVDGMQVPPNPAAPNAKSRSFIQYVDAGDANPKNLAKLAQFISKSISSQSQSLGTGGVSQPLTI
jgi:uncharacterized protein YegL